MPLMEVRAMTRDEHLKWCKQRALECLPRDPGAAVASMASDLRKHEAFRNDTYTMLIQYGIMEATRGPDAVRRWVEGFN